MACYQSSAVPAGISASSLASYKTEAECLQACKEGACCEGTTCTVKPQCQCQCTTGRCCGPDTATVSGVTGQVCRGGTKQECDQRGGTWTCGYTCPADEKSGVALCSSEMLANPNLPVFRGAGTTCSPNPCVTPCGRCSCAVAVAIAGINIPVDGNSYLLCFDNRARLASWLDNQNLYVYASAVRECKNNRIQVTVSVGVTYCNGTADTRSFTRGQTVDPDRVGSRPGVGCAYLSRNERVFEFQSVDACDCPNQPPVLVGTTIRATSITTTAIVDGLIQLVTQNLCDSQSPCLAEFLPCTWSTPAITKSCECQNPLP